MKRKLKRKLKMWLTTDIDGDVAVYFDTPKWEKWSGKWVGGHTYVCDSKFRSRVMRAARLLMGAKLRVRKDLVEADLTVVDVWEVKSTGDTIRNLPTLPPGTIRVWAFWGADSSSPEVSIDQPEVDDRGAHTGVPMRRMNHIEFVRFLNQRVNTISGTSIVKSSELRDSADLVEMHLTAKEVWEYVPDRR